MAHYDYLVYIFLLTAVALSILTRKLTIAGALSAGIIGLLVYKGFGLPGLSILITFFILGTIATKWGAVEKEKSDIAERDKGRRTAGQVFANGGVATILGAAACFWPGHLALLRLMMAGSLASATADTLSSELGSIYGSRFFDIISFKRSERGPDGVVSLEGTLIGVFGAVIIAVIFSLYFGWNNNFGFIIISGTLGNIADSVLGATLERKGLIGNNAVNFLNTATGAAVSFVLMRLLK